MKTVDKVALALVPFIGKTLTSKQIVAVTLAKYPDTNQGSILPSDYAGPNPKSGAVYADQILTRTATGFLVLPVDKRVNKPSTRGTRGESLESALASAQALLTAPKATSTPANSTPAVKAEVSKTIASETAKPIVK